MLSQPQTPSLQLTWRKSALALQHYQQIFSQALAIDFQEHNLHVVVQGEFGQQVYQIMISYLRRRFSTGLSVIHYTSRCITENVTWQKEMHNCGNLKTNKISRFWLLFKKKSNPPEKQAPYIKAVLIVTTTFYSLCYFSSIIKYSENMRWLISYNFHCLHFSKVSYMQ